MNYKLSLSSEEILNHVFKSSYRGYNPLEVDQFLDKVISDYKKIESEQEEKKRNIEKSLEENKKLSLRIYELESELARYRTKYSNLKPSDNVNLDNINYIRRINALETFLFKNGFDPSKIK